MNKFIKVLMTSFVIASGLISSTKVLAKENKIVVYAPQPATLNEKINKAFTEKTGIEVESFTGTNGEILAKLDAQKDDPEVDVIIMSSWADGMVLSKNGALMQLGIKNSDKLNKGFIDDKKTLFGYSAVSYGIAYNKDTYPKFNKEIKDLTSDEYAGTIVIADPLKSVSSMEFMGYFLGKNGEEAFKKTVTKLVGDGMYIDSGHKMALEKLSEGSYGLLLGAIDYNVYQAKAQGSNIEMYFPKDSTIINPRPAMVPQTSKNQEGAKTYIEFLLSEEGQKIVAEEYLIPGISDAKVVDRVEFNKLPQNTIDYEKIKEFDNKALTIFKEIKDSMEEE